MRGRGAGRLEGRDGEERRGAERRGEGKRGWEGDNGRREKKREREVKGRKRRRERERGRKEEREREGGKERGRIEGRKKVEGKIGDEEGGQGIRGTRMERKKGEKGMGKKEGGAQDVRGGGDAGAPAPLINASFDMIHSASGKSGKCLHYLGGESWSRWCFPLISPLRTRGRKVVGTINQRGNMTLIVRAMGRGLRRSPAVHYHPGGARQPQGPYQCPVRMPFRSPRALLQRAAPDGDASPLGTPPGRWHSRLGDASRALLSACGSWRWMTVWLDLLI